MFFSDLYRAITSEAIFISKGSLLFFVMREMKDKEIDDIFLEKISSNIFNFKSILTIGLFKNNVNSLD